MKKIRSSSLLIGKVINQELRDIIKVFPIVAPIGTTGDFAVYKRLNLSVENTKDIYNFNEITDIAVTVVTDSYEKGLELSTNIKMYLEHLEGEYRTKKEEKIKIGNITLIDASEDWNNDKYIQSLVFRVTLYNEPSE